MAKRARADSKKFWRSAVFKALVVSFVLHAPLLPNTLFSWVELMFSTPPPEADELDGDVIIPIELDLLGEPGAAPAAAKPAPLPEHDVIAGGEPVQAPIVAPTATAAAKPSKDAGVDAEADAATAADAGDGGANDAADEPHDAGEVADATDLDAETDASVDAEAGVGLLDPLATAGDVSKVPIRSSNVQIMIAADVLRTHPLGAEFSHLLTSIPQWKAFFEGSDIDPINDVSHVLIAGPQFRDASRVTAVLELSVGADKMRAAVNRILAKSDPPGEWLTDTKLPVARARVGGADRLFVLFAKQRILMVVPLEAKAQIAGLPEIKPFPKSTNVGIIASTITPAKALREVPLKIPGSLTKLVVVLIPTKDGGADVEIEATDASAEEAVRSARDLNAQIDAVRVISVFGFRRELFAPIVFAAEDARIRAKTHVSRSEIAYVIGTFQRTFEARQKAEEQAKADAGRPSDAGAAWPPSSGSRSPLRAPRDAGRPDAR